MKFRKITRYEWAEIFRWMMYALIACLGAFVQYQWGSISLFWNKFLAIMNTPMPLYGGMLITIGIWIVINILSAISDV